MKKIFTVLSMVAITATATAQMNAFAGADFEDWNAFLGGLNSYGLSTNGGYVSQGIGTGIGNSKSLKLSGTPSKNDYTFTALAPSGVPATIESISFWVKGTSAKSLSLNLYKEDGTYYVYNVGDLGGSNVTLQAVASNQYTGVIDTAGKWVKVTLDVSSITDYNKATNGNFLALKVGKEVSYALDLDNFQINSSSLAVVDINKSKTALVKNTSVSDNLFFAKTADVKIINTAGQVVKEVKATEGSSVNISSLPKGMYMVTGTVNGEAVSQKIIKK